MIKFEVGRTYFARLATDHDTVLMYEVVKRTEKTVWLKDRWGESSTKRVSEYNDIERVSLGNYSMAPILTADREYRLWYRNSARRMLRNIQN